MTTEEYKCPDSEIDQTVLLKFRMLESLVVWGDPILKDQIDKDVKDLEEYGPDYSTIYSSINSHLEGCDSCRAYDEKMEADRKMRKIFRSHLRRIQFPNG